MNALAPLVRERHQADSGSDKMLRRVLRAGVLDVGSHAVDLGCGGQLCSDPVSWHMGACHWLHGMHVLSVEHECTLK